MTIAGDTVRFVVKNIKNFAKQAVPVGDVDSVTVEVWNEDFTTQVQAPNSMEYDSETETYGYVWGTPEPDGAIYQARAHVVLNDGSDFYREKALLVETRHGP